MVVVLQPFLQHLLKIRGGLFIQKRHRQEMPVPKCRSKVLMELLYQHLFATNDINALLALQVVHSFARKVIDWGVFVKGPTNLLYFYTYIMPQKLGTLGAFNSAHPCFQ